MQTLSSEINNDLTKVKKALRDCRKNNFIKQEIPAIALDVNQSTYSRYEDPESGMDIPLGALPGLHREKRTRPIAIAALSAIGARFVDFPSFEGLDGKIDDELLKTYELEGMLSQLRNQDPKKAIALINRIREMMDRMQVELEAKQK